MTYSESLSPRSFLNFSFNSFSFLSHSFLTYSVKLSSRFRIATTSRKQSSFSGRSSLFLIFFNNSVNGTSLYLHLLLPQYCCFLYVSGIPQAGQCQSNGLPHIGQLSHSYSTVVVSENPQFKHTKAYLVFIRKIIALSKVLLPLRRC